MNLIITGGAGFIGSHLVDALIGQNHQITVIDDLSNGAINNIEHHLENPKFTFIKADIAKPRTINQIKTADTIYHLACWPRSRSYKNPRRDIEVNLTSTVNILEYAKKHGSRIIFSSNSGIYDSTIQPIREGNPENPTTPYDVNKLASEHMIKAYSQAHGLKYSIFRFATVYGPRQCSGDDWKPVVVEFCKRLLAGEAPTINGDGSQSRDLIYVSDIVTALVKALQRKEALGKIMILGTGIETTVNEIYEAAVEATGIRLEPLHGERAKGDIDRMQYDCRHAQSILGWSPKVGLKEGVLRTVKWMKKGG